jgi:hypothetical protein
VHCHCQVCARFRNKERALMKMQILAAISEKGLQPSHPVASV